MAARFPLIRNQRGARQAKLGGRFPAAVRRSDSHARTETQSRPLPPEPEHRGRWEDGSCGHDGRWGNRGRGPFATENRSNHEDRRMATRHRRFLTAC
jgi:hypothetical protein